MKNKNLYPTNDKPFERKDWLRQANSVAYMEYHMELIQLKAYACFLNELEPMYLELIDIFNSKNYDPNKQPSIMDTKAAKPYIRNGLLWVRIPLSSLGVKPNGYFNARNMIEKMNKIVVRVPSFDDKKNRTISGGAFYVETEKEKGEKSRSGHIRLGMIQDVLDALVDVRMGYHRELKRIPFLVNNVFTARLYALVSTHKKEGVSTFSMPLTNFRNFMDLFQRDEDGKISVRYARYYDLENRVIKPAVDELRDLADTGNSDFFVEITRVKKKEDDELIIKVFPSDVAKLTKKSENFRDEDRQIIDILYKKLKQSKTNVNRIITRLTPENRTEFHNEVKNLVSVVEHRTDISDIKAYAWSSLNNWMNDHEPKVIELDKNDDSVSGDPVSGQLLLSFKEDENFIDPRWAEFTEVIQGLVSDNIYTTWFSPMSFISEKNGIVRVGIPSRFIGEYIEGHLLKEFNQALTTAFGQNIQLEYALKK